MSLKRLALAAVALSTLLLAGPPEAVSAKKKPVCGYVPGAACCQAWGNTCISPELSCCNGTCVEKPYNATNPESACGIKAPDACLFDELVNPDAKVFDRANAYMMTIIATGAYPATFALSDKAPEFEDMFKTTFEPMGFTQYTFINTRADTNAVCMADKAGNVVLVYRGTSSTQDVLTDTDMVGSLTPSRSAMGKSIKGLKVHDGFEDAYLSARDQTRECVKQYMESYGDTVKPRLWIGGHSLGGALATLAAGDVKAHLNYTPIVYTIGSPRVGNQQLVTYYDTTANLKPTTFRMVNGNDPVPRVPLQSLGYRHVGQRVYLNATSPQCAAVGQPDTECNPKCITAEHYTDKYLPATRACAEQSAAINFKECPLAWAAVPVNYSIVAGKPKEEEEQQGKTQGQDEAGAKASSADAALSRAALSVLAAAAVMAGLAL